MILIQLISFLPNSASEAGYLMSSSVLLRNKIEHMILLKDSGQVIVRTLERIKKIKSIVFTCHRHRFSSYFFEFVDDYEDHRVRDSGVTVEIRIISSPVYLLK